MLQLKETYPMLDYKTNPLQADLQILALQEAAKRLQGALWGSLGDITTAETLALKAELKALARDEARIRREMANKL